MLSNKTIIVGVTGGIAAYKVCGLVSRLKQLGADVWVAMTPEATKLVAPLTFRTLSKNPVITDLFSDELSNLSVPHISLAKKADLVIIAPATANIIGKIAGGIADDPVSTIVMSATCPKLLAPAMNCEMWRNPLVVENFKKLRKLKYKFTGPVSGRLACGDDDIGRMSEPEEIVSQVIKTIGVKQDLKGKHVLVTAGGTREAIDPVRYISNRSSGKMGYALAQTARERGATVTLISGPTNLAVPEGVELIRVESAEEMLKLVLENFNQADVVIMAAAVSDYSPKLETRNSKLKTKKAINLRLQATKNILKELSKQNGRKDKIIVGFALETDNLIKNAKKKLKQKALDLIVANDPKTFDGDQIKFSLINKKGKVKNYPGQTKQKASQTILDQLQKL